MSAKLHYNHIGFYIASPIRIIFLWKIVENNISPFLVFLPLQVPHNPGALDCYTDSEFLEIDNNVMLGEGAIIMSSTIVGNFLHVKRVNLRDKCIIGAFNLISPSMVVEERTM